MGTHIHPHWYTMMGVHGKSEGNYQITKLKDSLPNDKSKSVEMGFSLLTSLRVPMTLGVCLGLVPIQGVVFGEDVVFRYMHYRTGITLVVAISIFLHTIAITHFFFDEMLHQQNNAGDLVLKFSGVWFYFVGTFSYVYFLLRSKQICQFFKTWEQTSKEISSFLLPDKRLKTKINLVTALIFIDCIGENIFYHIHAMKVEERGGVSISEFFRVYFKSNQYIFAFFDYNPFIAVAMLVTNKLATYAWNFIDIILLVICMVLKERYWALNHYLQSLIDRGCEPAIRIRKGIVSWSSVRNTFHMITELLLEANKLLTPLIWISYVTDVFFVCRQFYELFSPRPSQRTPLNQIYMVWSLLHLIARTLGVYLMGSFLNEEAHKTFNNLQYCDPDEFDEEVRRLEIFLGNNEIGISGSGCFKITRSFVLMIISGIFTLEVVLLQNAHLTIG